MFDFPLSSLKPLLFAVPLLVSFGSLGAKPRPSQELDAGWKFIKQDVGMEAASDSWETVSVPHTWNSVDGAQHKDLNPQFPDGYYRGPAWYARALDLPPSWKGKRVFIRFEGVSMVGKVFVNSTPVGEHRGAFSAFCFEITPHLKFDGKDSLRVYANNERNLDIAPISGDFTVFGGIYRPVKVFATDEACISPLEFGSPGVLLSVKSADAKQATVSVKTFVSSDAGSAAGAELEVKIKNAKGEVVAKSKQPVQVADGKVQPVIQELQVPNPRLWNGKKDPYLYSATVELLKAGKPVDEVIQPLGIRTVGFAQDGTFLLNGQALRLFGVNRHQERVGKGWAISAADHEEDHAMIQEIGANAIRLCHYQHADLFHTLSDRAGIVSWSEIPLVDCVGDSPEFLANARQQLTEMIYQCQNHPSIGMWGLFNELDANWAPIKNGAALGVIENLQPLAKELDPLRPTVAASQTQPSGPRHKISEGIGWNIYPGWYGGKPEHATGAVKKHREDAGKKVAISEYGAGANPVQFQETKLGPVKPGGEHHPQEWQNYFHESLWGQLRENSNVWGTYVWVMFDFAVAKRNEGSLPGLNDKGLVTRDRKLKKDTFFFYKANWNPEPMVYLASRRMTPRKVAATEVRAYSNCASLELKVNGKSLGSAKPDDTKIARWPEVTLQPGKNTIEVRAKAGKKVLTDSCEWVLEAAL